MDNTKVNSKNIVVNLGWRFFETIGTQLAMFAVQVVMARLLAPSDFGVIGIVTVFNTLAMVFIQSGFSTAIIQKKNIDQSECSSVFYTSMIIAALIYVILFFCAPFIASFYEYSILTDIIRVQFLGLFVMPLSSIQNSLIQKRMQFKLSFLRGIANCVVSGAIGIIAALMGAGIWALVFYNLSNYVVGAIVYTLTVKWWPSLTFSLKKVKTLFSFGWKVLVSSLIDTLYNNIYTLVIGKLYNKTTLGYYNKGKNFPNTVVNSLNTTIQSVIFPALATCQDDKVKFKALVRRAIKTSTFLVFPAMAGLAAVAKPLIVILLTEKWLPAVFFLQICCFSYALWPIHTANLQAINAIGRSDIFLKLEVIKKVIGIVLLVATVPFGVYVMVSTRALSGIISCFINAYPNKKLLDYSFFEQIKDILPSALLSIAMAVIVWLFTLLDINYFLMLILQVVAGAGVYILGAKIFKLESYDYMISLVKSFIKKKKA